MTSPAEAMAARQDLVELCRMQGVAPPAESGRQHLVQFGAVALRWESHAEFTTWTWQVPGDPERPFEPAASVLMGNVSRLTLRGEHLVSVDLHLLADREGACASKLGEIFDASSLAATLVSGSKAIAATDFRSDGAGFVRILVLDRGLSPLGAGALTQRLLEIETYRTLALLGLPEVHRLAPCIDRAEGSLARITRTMTEAKGLDADHLLLDELTGLAAEIEASVVSSSFRFAASRAYDEIVEQRLVAIGQTPFDDWSSLSSFLSRRMAPAMRTCRTFQERQSKLSEKLARAANLLRTRVDVEIERQNRDLLHSMNRRARMQLRLQQTVEGLSVAAISYYVVGLVSYVLHGLSDAGVLKLNPSFATAVSVPLAVGCVALLVWRIHAVHRDDS